MKLSSLIIEMRMFEGDIRIPLIIHTAIAQVMDAGGINHKAEITLELIEEMKKVVYALRDKTEGVEAEKVRDFEMFYALYGRATPPIANINALNFPKVTDPFQTAIDYLDRLRNEPS